MARKSSAATDTPASETPDNLSSLQLKLDPEPAPVPSPEPAPAAQTDDTTATAPEVIPQDAGGDEPRVSPGLAAQMRQWGYEVDDDATDDDVRKHLESLEEDRVKAEAERKELEQLRQYRAQVEAQRVQPEPKPTAQPKPAEAATDAPADDDLGIPERPQLDKFTHQVLQFANANGKLTEAGGYVRTDDPTIQPHVDAYNKHLAEVRAYDEEWTAQKIADHLYQKRIAAEREAIKQQVLEEVKGTFRERDQKTYFDSFREQNAKWLYTPDGTAWTEVGQQFAAEVDDLMARGFSPDDAVKRAKAFVQAETGKTPWIAEQPKPQDTPAEKVVKFRNRLKNNGADTISTHPVTRPAAGAATRTHDGLSFHQKLSAHFSDLMNEKVADRM